MQEYIKKILGSGHNHPSCSALHNTTLTISNDKIEDIKIVKSHEDSGLLLKAVTEIVQNEVKEQKGGFLSAFLGTLGASLLEDLLIGNIKGKGVLRAGYGNNNSKMDF